MTQPIASIVICVYNRADQALQCLESLLQLDFKDYEIVLVDDASTDDTLQTLETYINEHPQVTIRIVRNEKNLGVSGARNTGIRAAQGNFVFFTDSDCTVEPTWLGYLVNAFQDPNIDAVSGTVSNPPPTNLAELAYTGSAIIGQRKIQQRHLIGGNMGFRRGIAQDFLFDEALTYGGDEDEIAWRMRSEGHQFKFIPEAVVYHHHPMTMSSYLRHAWKQGKGSARFFYKQNKYLGRDILFLILFFLSLPLCMLHPFLILLPVCFAALQLAAMIYNQRILQGKTWPVVAKVLPVNFLFLTIKTCSILKEHIAILFHRVPAIRESKKVWQTRTRSNQLKS